MVEQLKTKCKDCGVVITKSKSSFLVYRHNKYFVRKISARATSKGKNGYYCNECEKVLLKNG